MKINLCIFWLFLAVKSSSSERLEQQIYSQIEGGLACFRRLNGTHQTGCTTPDDGSVGVVQMIRDISDAQWMILNGTAGPYMAVVDTELFADAMEHFMNHPQNVAGVLVYENGTNRDYHFSPESKCPNEYSSASGAQCSSSEQGGVVWNERGTDLLRLDIPFPIFFVPYSQILEIKDKVEKCYSRYNLDRDSQSGRPLCSLQMNSFQFAAINTEVCMRRSSATAVLTSTKVCDPLSGNNVLYSLYPRTKDHNDTVTLVTARIDTASLFDGVAPGAAGAVLGMVTLLATATTLSKMLPIDGTLHKNNVLFTLFNGESFDYIGSQRVAYDISQGEWPPNAPLNPAQISLHFELGQLGGSLLNTPYDRPWPLYGYAPYQNVPVPSEVTEFLAEMSTHLVDNMTVQPEFTLNLPPSSIHSFRRILKNETESGSLPEMLLVDHHQTFTNKFYHSALDDDANLAYKYHNISIGENGTFEDTDRLVAAGTMQEGEMAVRIARLATALSRSLYSRVLGTSYAGNLSASAHMVDEMLYCYLKNQGCQLLLASDYYDPENTQSPPTKPAPLYVSVSAWVGSGAVYSGHMLVLLTGRHLDINRTACGDMETPGYTYHYLRGWINTGVCIESTLNFTQAISPAFTIKNYEYKSGLYSTWTESVWKAMWVRVFVRAGGGGARAAAAAGAAVTLLAAALVYWLKTHAALLFPLPATSVPADAASGMARSVNC